MDIEWKTYVEPVEHVRAQVTEANVLDFCREYGWSVAYVEKAVAPFPDGRATVMQVSMDGHHGRVFDVPFWVEQGYDGKPRQANAPSSSWEVRD